MSSDVTFVRGYGFPRGGAMDYAGLGDAGCDCGGRCGPCGQRRAMGRFASRAVRMPEASLFETIPALDGYNETEGSVDLTFGPLELEPNRVLPTLDPQTGRWYNDAGQQVDPDTGAVLVGPQYQPGGSGGGVLFALLGLGLVGAALFLK